MPQAPGPTKENVYKKKNNNNSRHQANRDEHRSSGVSKRNGRRRWGMGLSRSTRLLRIVRRERFLCLFIALEVEVEVQI